MADSRRKRERKFPLCPLEDIDDDSREQIIPGAVQFDIEREACDDEIGACNDEIEATDDTNCEDNGSPLSSIKLETVPENDDLFETEENKIDFPEDSYNEEHKIKYLDDLNNDVEDISTLAAFFGNNKAPNSGTSSSSKNVIPSRSPEQEFDKQDSGDLDDIDDTEEHYINALAKALHSKKNACNTQGHNKKDLEQSPDVESRNLKDESKTIDTASWPAKRPRNTRKTANKINKNLVLQLKLDERIVCNMPEDLSEQTMERVGQILEPEISNNETGDKSYGYMNKETVIKQDKLADFEILKENNLDFSVPATIGDQDSNFVETNKEIEDMDVDVKRNINYDVDVVSNTNYDVDVESNTNHDVNVESNIHFDDEDSYAGFLSQMFEKPSVTSIPVKKKLLDVAVLKEAEASKAKTKKTRKRKDIKMYDCGMCDAYGSRPWLRHHMSEYIDKEETYCCSKCSTKFNTMKTYLVHLPQHGYTPKTCPECDRSFKKYYELGKHIQARCAVLLINVFKKTIYGMISHKRNQCRVCLQCVEAHKMFNHWESHLKVSEPVTGITAGTLKLKPLSPMSQNEVTNTEKKTKKDSQENKGDTETRLLSPQMLKEVIAVLVKDTSKTDRLSCVVCQRPPFLWGHEEKRHMVIHLLKDAYLRKREHNSLRCQICHKDFRQERDYRLHVRLHGNMMVYECPKCQKLLCHLTTFAKHKRNHGVDDLVCNVCKKKFKDKQALINHIKAHEQMAPITSECSQVFHNLDAYKRHHQMSRNKDELDQNEDTDPEEKTEKDSQENESDTETELLSPQMLKEVLAMFVEDPSNTRRRSCVVCQRPPFPRRQQQKRHILEHLLKDAFLRKREHNSLRCQMCHKDFKQVTDYRLHMRFHGKMTIYECPMCQKHFCCTTTFEKHKKIHGVDGLVCDVCKKKFKDKQALIDHMMVHMITRANISALPPPTLTPSPSSSSVEEFATPPDTTTSSRTGDVSGPPPPGPPARRARRFYEGRMRWTYDLNVNCMRAYYWATEGGTNLSSYRGRMLPLFQALDPAVDISAQRLSDRVRSIQRSQLLDQPTLDRLRLEELPVGMTSSSTRDRSDAMSRPSPVIDSVPVASRMDPDADREASANTSVSGSKSPSRRIRFDSNSMPVYDRNGDY